MLDFIDSDSDDDLSDVNLSNTSVADFNLLSTLVMQTITQHRKSKIGHLNVLFLQSQIHDPNLSVSEKTLITKLLALSYITVTTDTTTAVCQQQQQQQQQQHQQYDVVIDIALCLTSSAPMTSTAVMEWKQLHALLVPGGVCCVAAFSAPPPSTVRGAARLWVSCAPAVTTTCAWSGTLRKSAVCCNSTGALYWADTDSDTDTEKLRDREHELLETISVTPTVAQRLVLQQQFKEGQEEGQEEVPAVLLQQAVGALREHGVCVLRGFFSPQVVGAWGDAALQDFEEARRVLLDSRDIDLYRPREGQVINNFHELSMREAMRVDLRNGRAVRALSATSTPPLGGHPAVRRVVQAAMREQAPGPFADGNWGLWNFGGQGPLGEPPAAVVGKPGAVISLGGCVDQTVHSDTAHPFTCSQPHPLPAHYMNLFLIAPDSGAAMEASDLADLKQRQQRRRGEQWAAAQQRSDGPEASVSCMCCNFRAGQTAFIAGSHLLEVSSMCMNGGEEGEMELMRRLLRPHLQPGDALLFDCRALHFGLANTTGSKLAPITSPAVEDGQEEWTSEQQLESERGMERRTLLYVNYHQPWFSDPKNWNDKERLFT